MSAIGRIATAPAQVTRRLRERTSLQTKLIALLLLLVAAALAAAGVAAVTTLDRYLVGRLDQQVQNAAQGVLDRDGGPPADRGGRGPLPGPFVVEAQDAAGAVVYQPVSNLVDARTPLPRFPSLTSSETRERRGHPFTVPSQRGDNDWRVVALPLGNGGGTLLVAESMADVQSTVARLELLELLIGVAAVLVVAAVAGLVVQGTLRPLRQVEDTAAAIAGGDLTRRVPERDPRTEIGRLTAALNGMLHQIEAAFRVRTESEARAKESERTMRQFVADASHELRTPLTSIRGFAELYRQGATPTAADVDRAMERIEAEATRMGTLVEDLLLLARMDQQRPLRSAPVDLLAVVTAAVQGARAGAPDRRITLEVADPDPPPVVMGDADRLHQVMGNLLSNAVRHTPPGGPVTVRLGTAGGSAVVEVADEGPGLSGDEAARVFERFYRADGARSRDDGGAGLGLAIVHALVTGHGGVVELDTAPGAGATFRVRLPLAA